jgi:predicted Zn finger-like uncharacterized protein
MHVTCSNCGARYAVDPARLGQAGRTVQCARCNHRWFEKPEAAPAVPDDSPSLRERLSPDVVFRPPVQEAGLSAPPAPPRPKSLWAPWLSGTVVLLLLLGVAIYAWRGEIRDRMPPTWRAVLTLDTFHALFGPPSATIQPSPPDEARLRIDLDASKIELVDGRYVVQGEIVNTGDKPGSTSRLRVIFRKNDGVIGERSYPLVEGPIGPGDRLRFHQTLDDPPPGTTDIVPAVD